MLFSVQHYVLCFAIGKQTCHKTALKLKKTNNCIITSKCLSYTTTIPVISPPFISNFVLDIILRRNNMCGRLSGITKENAKRKNKITFAYSYLAIAVVFALQRMLELFHLVLRLGKNCCLFHGHARVSV